MVFVNAPSDADKRIILHEHNKYRGEADPPPKYMFKMYWDEEAAKTALGWANSMCHARGGGPDHDPITARFIPGRDAYGQNWFCASGKGSTWQQAIKSWYDEKEEENFNFEDGGNEGTGHYTQIMWADSMLVGCGMIYCEIGKNPGEYFVCNYARSGNEPDYYGKNDRPYNKSETIRGSSCKENFNNETGLCECKDVMFCLNGGRMNSENCTCICPNVPWIVGPNCELDCTKGVTDDSGHSCSRADCDTDNIFDKCPVMCGLCSKSGNMNYAGEAAKLKGE
ncbi:cysteine-rich venom protein VAR8-like [Tubulanus polymorphus]|uniref:cysteine-rich venom protein VAR8-like n=1 Tax=Tubulanus polymorphus TaxID=672921 RepID=UPI003DA4B4E1